MMKMVEKDEPSFQVKDFMIGNVNKEDGDEDHSFCEELRRASIVNGVFSLESSINSMDSSSSSCSSELMEDASSSTSNSSSSSSSNGPLYELSDLMAHLPIKKGLSKYYEGKSQSFTSLATVKSTDDLVKRAVESSCKKRMKSCTSYGGNLDPGNRSNYNPKAIIKKKASKGTIFVSSLSRSRRSSLFGNHDSIPVHRS